MKILIIEDDEGLNSALRLSLEREGYAVNGILDGEKGEKHLALNNVDYDLVILDLTLPTRSGLEICKAARDQGISTPILILTGKDGTQDKISALDAGADDYLTKPFSIEELSARVRALLRRPKKTLSTELKVSDLSMNLATRKVYRNGVEIPLTLKEFSILEYFMRNPNMVLTRDEILDHVWDFNFSSFSNVMDVHINNLRKKINPKGHNYLETIRGVGYRLNINAQVIAQ